MIDFLRFITSHKAYPEQSETFFSFFENWNPVFQIYFLGWEESTNKIPKQVWSKPEKKLTAFSND
jgi:hypothetical protein